MKQKKVWFITGASKGLGLLLVKQLLAQGYLVAATSRSLAELNKAVGSNDNFLPLVVDMNSEANVTHALAQTVQRFGQLDVVVNNAGYGLLGAQEELTDEEVRKNFDVNVFGLLHVVRQAMPYLRRQQSGHIFNISSIGGFTGAFAGWGIYCATKFAVQGLSEALFEEAKGFGVQVTVVLPGYFRTNFLSAGSLALPANAIGAYKAVRASADLHQQQLDQQQPGDPEKAVAAIIRIANEKNPPLYLFLGQDAYDMAYRKIEVVQKNLEAWKALTVATGFEPETPAYPVKATYEQ